MKILPTTYYMLHTSRRGQVIVEALVALSILMTGFLGMLTLLSRSLFISRAVSDDYTASYLAAEGIEIVKNIIDTNALQKLPWNSGFSTNGTYEADYSSSQLRSSSGLGERMVFDAATGFFGRSGNSPTNFYRKIVITNVDLNGDSVYDATRVNSVVSWTTGALSKSINLEDRFFDWRP